jgi:hypothetical protein
MMGAYGEINHSPYKPESKEKRLRPGPINPFKVMPQRPKNLPLGPTS